MGKIAYIGLGVMGQGMAKRLLSAGYDVTVYNRSRDKAEAMMEFGAKVGDTPKSAVLEADIVISCLADPPAVKAVMYGEEGAIAGMKAGAILIDMSTIDPSTSIEIAEELKKRGKHMLDAPVGGSRVHAAEGQLTAMVGGEESVLERCRPVLDTLCKAVIYTGPNGSGAYTKLCFNLIVSHMTAAIAEALILGEKAGVKGQVILDTIMNAAIASKYYEWKGGCMMDRDFTTNFSTKLMLKDLNLIMSAAYGLDLSLPVTASVKELFAAAKATGHAEEDFCSVVKVLESIAGIELSR